MGATTTEMVIGSVQHLEYSISDALNKVTTVKQKKQLQSKVMASCKMY
jgi:hypothetical protein